MKAKLKFARCHGFALVVTLALMVLLALLAVGLLTLSSISLRTASQSEAMATARANARLALILALGELQRSAGLDQRVTARADILDEAIANPQLTGVWESTEIKPTAPPKAADYEADAKSLKFRAWLVSNPDPEQPRKATFANQATTTPVTLWGKGTLGDRAADKGLVTANKVPLNSSPGALAWAVLDEGIKARVNTPFINGANTSGAKTVQLGTGERPGVEFITGLTGLERGMFERKEPPLPTAATIEKGITRLNFALASETLAPGTRDALKSVTHDVTTHSIGLLTDTARGGLKQDFQLLTNATTLPTLYNGKGVYASVHKMKTSEVPSDPTWASLHQFSRIYRGDKAPLPAVTSSSGVPVVKMQTPPKWAAATVTGDPQTSQVTTINRTPPPGMVLMPTIAKVQMLFSLIGRDLYGNLPPYIQRELTKEEKANGIHGPQDGNFRESKYNYDLHILYTPIVTLHNPYNVAIDCDTLRVDFVNVPLSVKIYRSGEAQSTDMVPFQTMTHDNEGGHRSKLFGMKLKNKGSDGKPDPGTGDPSNPKFLFRLLPGEVKVFSPYMDPELDYLSRGFYWDITLGDNKTNNMDSIPGWRGYGVGYDCDWVTGNKLVDQDFAKGHWGGCLGMAWNDEIYVEFTPFTTFPSTLPDASRNKFIVQMTAPDPSSAGNRIVASAIELDYESPTGLQTYMTNTGVKLPLRYPKTGTVKGVDLVDRALVKIKDLKYPKPFALLSVQAKSTNAARDTTNEDGRLGTKPWCFAHANIGASSQRVLTEHCANQSHEFDLQVLDVAKGATSLVSIDKRDRGNFISGHSTLYGTKFGLLYDVPLAPLQSFATLNGANPGGASGYLPRFAQPIGNSWAHPLISPAKLSETKTGGNYLDHSFLLNLAFYDSFYFSGLAAQTGPFFTGKSTPTLAAEFATDKPLDDPRLLLHRPDNRPASTFNSEVAKADAYTRVAAWQMMEGAFNVNSTSILAWKAMLASIHDSQALFNQLVDPASITSPSTNKLSSLAVIGTQEARISRFRLPGSTSAADGAAVKTGYWLGPREYSDAQLQDLATNIVKQVRRYGPFLSMGEFVNRRLGTDDKAQRGALQQAIDDSTINKALATAAAAGFEISAAAVKNYKYVNPTAGTGSSHQGAPGFLTQADLLTVLGNAATPRSDTFTIRGYGEARDAKGNILASATCEAVVQRIPEWVDPADLVETAPAALVSQANKTFGRRFLITSLRWLGPNEI